MGTTAIYLLADDVSVDPETYRSRVSAVLQAMGVIGAKFDENDYEWYSPGDNSMSILVKSDDLSPGYWDSEGVWFDWEWGFDDCLIAASEHVLLIPQDPAVVPKCPDCSADLTSEFYEITNDIEMEFEGAAKAKQFIDARITCSGCRRTSALTELKDRVGIFLSNLWISFDGVWGGLDPAWLAEFEARTGLKHKALTYWYT